MGRMARIDFIHSMNTAIHNQIIGSQNDPTFNVMEFLTRRVNRDGYFQVILEHFSRHVDPCNEDQVKQAKFALIDVSKFFYFRLFKDTNTYNQDAHLAFLSDSDYHWNDWPDFVEDTWDRSAARLQRVDGPEALRELELDESAEAIRNHLQMAFSTIITDDEMAMLTGFMDGC